MTETPAPPHAADATGLVVVQRLHRLVRHGFRPWLGYDVASAADRTIELRRRGGDAILYPDGTLLLAGPEGLPPPGTNPAETVPHTLIPGNDAAAFDTRFPPDTPNRRNLMRRLYEIGVLA